MLLMITSRALGPSLSQRPPQPPFMVPPAMNHRFPVSGRVPEKTDTATDPESCAMTRSGRALARAPMTTLETRNCVSTLELTEAGGTGLRRDPFGKVISKAAYTPSLFGIKSRGSTITFKTA